jgi:hypothetical protein
MFHVEHVFLFRKMLVFLEGKSGRLSGLGWGISAHWGVMEGLMFSFGEIFGWGGSVVCGYSLVRVGGFPARKGER